MWCESRYCYSAPHEGWVWMNEHLIQEAYEAGADTVLTCDNGIAAFSQIEYANSLGMTVVVTDHHEVPYEEKDAERQYLIPPAAAVVDPKQQDCHYPFPKYAAQ